MTEHYLGPVRILRYMGRFSQRKLFFAALLLVVNTAAQAGVMNSPYFLGNWNGLRSDLTARGIDFNFAYGSEAAHNFSGGSHYLTRYTDQWVMGTTLDLDKLWSWQGASFQASITDRNGRNLGADANIGNNMLIQEVYGRGQTWHLTQFWLNQSLMTGRLQWKAGRLTVGEDFASFACDFQNLTFCGSQPGNLVGSYWINWPTSQWATRLKLSLAKESYAQLGIYQVNPKYGDDRYARHHGLSLDNPSGTTGVLIPLELGWLPKLQTLPGSYKIGVWYSTANGLDLYQDVHGQARGQTGLAPRERNGQYGVYINFEQQVSGYAGGPGALIFLNVSQADHHTAALDHQIALGMQYRGAFGQVRDVVGAALGATHNNSRYADYIHQQNQRLGTHQAAGKSYEYVAELYYSWSPIPAMFLRPNVQFIKHPGGVNANDDAFVVGVKTGITF